MKMERRDWRIHLVGALFLLMNAYPSYMFYNLNTYKMFILFLFLIVLLVSDLLVFKKEKKMVLEKWQLKTVGIISLLTVLVLPGALWHGLSWNYYLPNELSSNLLALGFLFYMLLTLKNLRALWIIFDYIAIGILYAFFVASIERLGFNIFTWMPIQTQGLRVLATYGNPNYLAGMLSLTLPFFFFAILQRFQHVDKFKSPSKRTKFYFVAFTLGMVTINMTGTRAAMGGMALAVVMGILYSFLIYDKLLNRKQKQIVLLLFTVPLIGFLFVDGITGFPFLKRIWDLTSTVTWAPRLSPWLTALKSIADSPIVGYGIGSSYNLFFEYVNPDIRFVSNERSFSHAHSEILELGQEGGVLFLVFYILFWAIIFKRLWEMMRKGEGDLRFISYGLFFSFIAYLIHGNVDVAPRMITVKLPLYMMMGMVFALYFKFYKNDHAVVDQKWQKIYLTLKPLYLIILFCLMYPWCYTMFKFTKFLQTTQKGVRETRELEKVVDEYVNIYAMEAIARQHYLMGNWQSSLLMMERMDKVIPHFRESDFYRSQVLKMLGRTEEAKKMALIYQERDYYLTPNLQFLMNFAIEEQDWNFYKKEAIFLVKKLIVDNRVFNNSAFDSDLIVLFVPENNFSISVEPDVSKDKTLIKVGEPFLRNVYDQLVFCRKNRDACTQQMVLNKRMELYNFTVQTKYFHKVYTKEVTKERGISFDQDIHRYMNLENKYNQDYDRLNQEISMIQVTGDPALRGVKLVEAFERLEKLKSDYKRDSESISNYLNDYFDFKEFYSRLKLAMSYIDKIYISAVLYRFDNNQQNSR